ncbi:MAG: carbohydrate kinase, partial [Planctomycetota bacterium]
NTDGSQGAARGAGIGAGIYKKAEDAFAGLKPVRTIEPDSKSAAEYEQAYQKWQDVLKSKLQM